MKKRAIDRLVITGPTGSGKSDFALHLCGIFPDVFEIISVDSVQIYRGLDIGSGKISPEQREAVPHHLIDIADPDETYDVSQFCAAAETLETEIRKRGRVPLFTGGTLLYLHSYFEGISPMPEAVPAVRDRLRDEAAKKGTAFLHKRLSMSDPESAQRIHENDIQRIIRALEVQEISGQTMTSLRNSRKSRMTESTEFYALYHNRELLYNRINSRFDTMIQKGFVEEVEGLLAMGFDENAPAMRSIGYCQILDYIKGRLTLEDAVDKAKKMTRRYAKKQMTWIKGYSNCITVEYKQRQEIAAKIKKRG